ncbi:MAG: Xaa-Pro dipeptidyl-peptidase [Longimicrobiales bacterium]
MSTQRKSSHQTLYAGATLAVLMSAPVNAQQPRRAAPVFENGQAQIVEAFRDSTLWIRHELWVEAEFDSDGDGKRDRMHVAVVRPRQTDTEGLKVAVVYESSPYYAGTSGARTSLWNVRQEVGAQPPARVNQSPVQARNRPGIANSHVNDWVPRGFAVVHSESPGTGLSQGCPTVGAPNESLAPKAVIDWLNGRAKGYTTVDGGEEVRAAWSTGKVGMTGTSYNGTLPLAAATTGVAGLEAIIPVAPNTSYYHYYRSNGLVRHPGGWLGEDIDFLFDYINSGHPERRAYCISKIRDGEMAAGRDRVTGDYNDFWKGRDYIHAIPKVKAATLMAHAFNDWNVVPEHSVRILEALKARGDVPVQSYFHQGGHGGAPPLEMMNRWFTRYLYDIQNGVEKDPRAWIVREGAERTNPTPYADYPNPAAAPVTLHPQAGGQGMGALSFTTSAQQGTETLVDNVSFDGVTLARAEWTNHRLVYATPELTDSVHISGTPRITIRVAASKAAANLSVWLVALPYTEPQPAGRGGPPGGGRGAGAPGGAANFTSLITRGWADPQNANSLTRGEPLAPGKFVELTFNLQPDDQIIPRGKRIGVMIMSSDRDFTLWPKPGTELTVDLDATSIVLPIVGGAEALRKATALGTN